MAHTNFVTSIRVTPYQHLVRTKSNNKHVFENSDFSIFQNSSIHIFKNMFIYRENYTESHTVIKINHL